jgi:hypothetical protein
MTEDKVGNDDECWDALGSSNDDDDDDEVNPGPEDKKINHQINNGRHVLSTSTALEIGTYPSQIFIKHNHKIHLSDQKVLILMIGQEKTRELDDGNIINNNPISKALHQWGIQVIHQKDLNETSNLLVDAMIEVAVTEEESDTNSLPLKHFIKSTLCPGGTSIISNTILDLDKDKTITEELVPTKDPTITTSSYSET